jgi:hypothetical protein
VGEGWEGDGGKANAKGRLGWSGGGGHTSPGKFWNLESLYAISIIFGVKSCWIPKIIKYIEDMNFPRHFSLKLNKLEKSA